MKYFYLGFAVLCIFVAIVAGPQGRHTQNRPIELFPDLVRQSKVKAQSNSAFFADGIGPRRPVEGAVPLGYESPQGELAKRINTAQVAGAEHPSPDHPSHSQGKPTTISNRPNSAFSGSPDYFNTGKIGDQWGTGIPIPVTAEVMARGQERFGINCAVCHGASGGGNGVTSKYGWNGIANYHQDKYIEMADGEIYNTITNGKNTMMGYGANISVEDRWAIVCYVRALQRAQRGKLEDLPPDQRAALATAK